MVFYAWGVRIMFKWLTRKIHKPDTSKISYLPSADIPVERVLNGAAGADLEAVTLVGWDREGKLYMASTYAKRGSSYWDLALMQRMLLDV